MNNNSNQSSNSGRQARIGRPTQFPDPQVQAPRADQQVGTSPAGGLSTLGSGLGPLGQSLASNGGFVPPTTPMQLDSSQAPTPSYLPSPGVGGLASLLSGAAAPAFGQPQTSVGQPQPIQYGSSPLLSELLNRAGAAAGQAAPPINPSAPSTPNQWSTY